MQMSSKTAAAATLLAVLMTPTLARAQAMGAEPPELNPSTKKPRILEQVGVDQRIGHQVPPDLRFRDETGRDVRIGDYFGRRPVVLALAYYNCPMLCTQVLNGIVGTLKTLAFQPGRDYEVVVVSIDARERARAAPPHRGPSLDDVRESSVLSGAGGGAGRAGRRAVFLSRRRLRLLRDSDRDDGRGVRGEVPPAAAGRGRRRDPRVDSAR